MPHAAGFTPDGYSNSWWDYFAPLDYVEETRAEEDGSFTFLYRSGKTESFRPDPVPAGEECTLYADVPGCAVRYTKDAVTVSKDGKTASVPRTGC